MRLLLSEEFFDKLEWALQCILRTGSHWRPRPRIWFCAERSNSTVFIAHDRKEAGKCQAVAGKGIVGNVEGGNRIQFRVSLIKASAAMPSWRFIVGPTIGWKPTANTRFDISPLIGATDDAPRISVFAVFSFSSAGKRPVEKRPLRPAIERRLLVNKPAH